MQKASLASQSNRRFSNDVRAAVLVFQKNETAAMLVYQTNPVGVDRTQFSYVKAFFPLNLHRCWPPECKRSIELLSMGSAAIHKQGTEEKE